MKLLRKVFNIEKTENLTVELVENFMISLGFTPLRWAVVKIEADKYIIDSVIVKKN